MSDSSLEHVRVYPLEGYAAGDTDVDAPGDAETAGLQSGRTDVAPADPADRDDEALQPEQELREEDIVTLEQGADGVFAVPDKAGTEDGGTTRGRGGHDGGSGDGGSGLWQKRDLADRPPHSRARPGRASAIAASVTAAALAIGYPAYRAAEDVSSGIHHVEKGLQAGSASPFHLQDGRMAATLQPEAETLAGEAISLSAAHDGHPALFHATQEGPGKVELSAGSDDFNPGITFDGTAAVIDVTLTGEGLDASHLTAGDARDVSEVFVEETTGTPHSGGSAIDTQVDISDPLTSQERDKSALFNVSGNEGKAWSGEYGVNNSANSNGYVGYGTDPFALLSGPGPNHGTPEFNNNYWGGGSPPDTYANNGAATQPETARDVIAEAPKVFHAALRDIIEEGSTS